MFKKLKHEIHFWYHCHLFHMYRKIEEHVHYKGNYHLEAYTGEEE